MSPPIYYQFGPDKDYAVTGAGCPVWPVQTTAELAALKSLCHVLGSSLEVASAIFTPHQIAHAEVVVGVGERVSNETALYAFLTSRVPRVVCGIEELHDDPLPSVVVAEPQDVNLELFDALYGRMDGDRATGIVCEGAGVALRQQVLLRAAAAAFQAEPAVRRIDYNGFYPLAEERDSGITQLGKLSPRDVVRDCIKSGAGVLAIDTHSDGVDAFLGTDLMVCNVPSPPVDVAPQHSLSCTNQGECHRLECSVEEALARNALLRPAEFRCCILVWNTCYSWIVDTDVLDRRWGILSALLRSSTIGAIVAVPGIYFNVESHDHRNQLSDALASGLNVGTAVAQANHAPRMKHFRQYYTLFGDPRTRLVSISDSISPLNDVAHLVTRSGSQNPVGEHDNVSSERAPMASRTTSQSGGLSFLACLIRQQLARLNVREKTAGSAWDEKYTNRTLKAFNEFCQFTESTRNRNESPAIVAAKLRREWVSFLVTYGHPISNWQEFARLDELYVEPRICPNCSKPARAYVTQLIIPETEDRRVTICQRCRLIEDAPVSSNLELLVSASNRFHLQGTLPVRNWDAKVRVWAQVPQNGETFDWPRDGDGLPSRDFDLPQALSVTGVCSIHLAMIHEFDFTILATRIGLSLSQ